jgi:hypothetical protein
MTFDAQKFRDHLPSEMLAEKRFVRYFLQPKEGGGTAKIPLGNHSDPETWSTFDDCVKSLEYEQGIGYCFLGGEIHGLDIDHCRNAKTGAICPEAMVLLSRIPSWAEYSVSGQGIHVLFKGQVRGKQLSETCVQYWHPAKAPRFFALTCDTVGDAFKLLKDVGEEFNYIFATARHISAKIREELKAIDPEQWEKLPAEREVIEVSREKTKVKSRKLHKDFNLEDFLKHYDLPVDNVTKNNLGTCYRLTTCPIKGEPHVGQNSTTTNFILSADGGLGFHCQSTGCVDYDVAQVIAKLTQSKPYPNAIWVKAEVKAAVVYTYSTPSLSERIMRPTEWLWKGFLPKKQLVHFGGQSTEGKSPVTLDLIARLTSGKEWPDGQPNTLGPRSVILMAGEDDVESEIMPRLKLAGADLSKVHEFKVTRHKDNSECDMNIALDRDNERLLFAAQEIPDLALIVIDPISNYLGSKKMNLEEEIRGGILMPLVTIAQSLEICVVTVGHLNKRDKDASILQRVMGAAAFVGVARQVFMFGNDPDDKDKYAHVMFEARNKSATKLKYRTEAVTVDWEEWKDQAVLRVIWCGVSTASHEDIINGDTETTKTEIEKATLALKEVLKGGRMSSTQCKNLVYDGIFKDRPDNFWHRARRKAKVGTEQVKGGWDWFLEAPLSLSLATTPSFDGDHN